MTGVRKVRWDDVRWDVLNERGMRRIVTGEKVMLAMFSFKKGAAVPLHKHVSEQISMVLKGLVRFTIEDGSTHEVGAGEVFIIPSNVGHAAEVLEDTQVMDVFSPPREDWLRGDDAYLRR
jgi:quercetin dioxygenase-like cupin family protein